MEEGIDLIKVLIEKGSILDVGAESILYKVKFLGFDAVLKYRVKKKYRINDIDLKIRRFRTYREASSLYEAYISNIPVPKLLYVNLSESVIIMEYISGLRLREWMLDKSGRDEELISKIASRLGYLIAKMHNINIVHGDLTTANIILIGLESNTPETYILDFGLSDKTESLEAKAVDIELFYRVLKASHTDVADTFFKSFINSYVKYVRGANEIIRRFNILRRMGRYVERRIRRRDQNYNK